VEVKNSRRLLGDMIAAARGYSATITDYHPGTPQWTLLHACAIELSRLWATLKRAWHSLFVALAGSEELSLRALDYGTTRGVATKSAIVVRATTSGACTMTTGVKVTTNLGMAFVTTETVVATGAGTWDIDAEAETAGAAGNIRQHTATRKLGTWPAQVTAVTNPYPALGGLDAETDDILRHRLMARWKLSALSMQDFYLAWLQETESTVLRCLASLNSNLGGVTIKAVKNSGADYSAGELTAMEDALVARVPLHVVAEVENVTYETIDIQCDVQTTEGAVLADVEDAIEDALTSYLDWRSWAWGGTVVASELLAIVQGVEDVVSVNTATFLPAANTTVDADALPKIGTVTVNSGYLKSW
jgi:hypothetical protein